MTVYSDKSFGFLNGITVGELGSLFPVVHNLFVKLRSSLHEPSLRPGLEEVQPLTLEPGTFQLNGLVWIVMDRVRAGG